MVDTNLLRGKIAEKGKSQLEIAKAIGITPKTFYNKMNKKVFGSDEIEIMIDELGIENPMEIFLPKSNLKSYKMPTKKQFGDMCNLSRGIEEKGILVSIKKLMTNLKFSLEQALDTLEISEEERPKYRKMLEHNDK